MFERLRRLGGKQPDEAATSAVPANARIDAATRAIRGRYLAEPELRAIPEVAALLDAPEAERGAIVLELARRRANEHEAAGSWSLLSLVARRRVVLSPAQLLDLVELVAAARGGPGNGRWFATQILEVTSQAIERSLRELPAGETGAAREALRDVLAEIDADTSSRLAPAARSRLREVAGEGTATSLLDALADDDNVGPALRAVLEPRLAAPGAAAFVAHLLAATKPGRPSAKWLATTRTVGSGFPDAPVLVRELLAAALGAEDGIVRYDYPGTVYEVARYIVPTNEAVLRNVVWAAAALEDPESLPLLRALATKSIQVIGGQFGSPRSLAVALACPAAIGAMAAPASLGTLQALQRSVRHGSVLREITKAIDALAAAASLTRSELLETAVDDHELDAASSRALPVGAWSAVVRVEPAGAVTTTWHDPDGRVKASLPKAVRDAEPDAAKAVAAFAKEVRATVATERDRLDRLFTEDRGWPLDAWRERYLAHPVTGALASSLVWRFVPPSGAEVVGIPARDGSAVQTESGAVAAIPPEAEVRLWHPVQATDDTVAAWRALLLAQRQGQALKQVFRETYTVTPAELETSTYSNRFARHIIRQTQVRALMKGRGWAPVPVAWWDDGIDHGVSRRRLEAHGLRAEFFFDPITDFPPTTSDLYPYCTTDQVRFFEAATDRPIALAEIEPVAFSEVMRDVDLFVGVTTIGADPEWLDRGERTFDTYWQDWGFGALSASAEVRRQVLETILPALTIADRCRLTDRYLEVRGRKRDYKVHLGSANILMSPSDRYLCIVAARHPSDHRLFLPFDDDPTLSLILSKAFLLADDDRITDPTITRQIDAA